jgi:hypothetical protein
VPRTRNTGWDALARRACELPSQTGFSGTRQEGPGPSWGVVVPKVLVGAVVAADRQQPMSVTTGEPARKPCRIMTADPAIDGL